MKILFVLIYFVFVLPIAAQTIEKTVFINALKETDERYFYVPFDVPVNAKSLSISYSYDKKAGANTLDLGVFDATADVNHKTLKGFRGWSGGRRNHIFIAENTASNGYLAGKIPSGKWNVIFGLYKVAAEGVEVKIQIKINEIDRQSEQEKLTETAAKFDFPQNKRSAPQETNGYKWFRGDLHLHTFHSDGNWTIEGLMDFAVKNNLDFIGITEHNTASHHAEINAKAKKFPELLVLKGEEITTYGGHINVWGLPDNETIDFRVKARNREKLTQVLSSIRKFGLAASINHPTALCGGCAWSYGEDWEMLDSVEIWNGIWDAADEAALQKWDLLLQKGVKITAIGSSDSHRPSIEASEYGTNLPLRTPTVYIGAKDLKQNSIIGAIRSHRTFTAENPNLFVSLKLGKSTFGDETTVKENAPNKISFSAENFPAESKLKLISGGKIVFETNVNQTKFAAETTLAFQKNTYLRMEIRDAKNKLLAFTNPLYITVKK